MKKDIKDIIIDGEDVKIDCISIEEIDRKDLRTLYNDWVSLNKKIKKFLFRRANMPEGVSESVFCLCFGKNYVICKKTNKKKSSFDIFDLKRMKRIQIKSSSIEDDVTSFGPKSVWDEIYFLDFYREGKFDGSFDVYMIPNDLIYNYKVNSKQTFTQQQDQGRRPRFSVKKLIKENEIKILKTCKI